MEIAVAVVRLCGKGYGEIGSDAFDVLLVHEPSSSSRHEVRMQLPRCYVPPDGDPTQITLSYVQRYCRKWPRRALEVPLWENSNLIQNKSLHASAQVALYCVPLIENAGGGDCFGSSWIREQQHKDADFLNRVFLRSAARSRIRMCAHNPAYEPQFSSLCYRRISEHDRHPGTSKQSCDLAEGVRRSNSARAKMMGYEKYEMFIINPIFGTGLCYKNNNDNEIKYFAKGVSLRLSTSSSSSSGGECWPEKYPLHKAAHDDNVDEIRRLLARGMKANEVDNASWTPLHYCAFYNNLKSMEILLLHQGTDVNAANKAGSTALHFAALQGNVYMVELLLSHPKINVNAEDCQGRRPIDVCACVPKAEYQQVAKLLLNWKQLNKVQVELMDGGNAQLLLAHGQDTTAEELHNAMCKELKFNSDSGKLFAMWICSDRLSLQLKAEHKPLLHMNKWKSKIAKFGNEEIEAHDEDTPKIFFRRDARLPLQDEKVAVLTPMALSLLYEECRMNYLKGFYPCSDRDLHALAAIMLRIIYGSNVQLTDQIFASVIPIHRLPDSESSRKTMRSRIESEHKARKGANLIKLQQEYLQICWRFSVYGATFFDAIAFMNKPVKGSLPVHAGVNDYGLHLINAQTKALFQSYPLKGLQWVMKVDRPYIEVHTQRGADLTLRTPQAAHINSLLIRLKDAAG